MNQRKILVVLFLMLFAIGKATHIVGGEILYDFIGNSVSGKNLYKVTLKVYRDCGPNTAQFDGIGPGGLITKAYLTVLTGAGAKVGVFDIGAPVVTQIPSSINNPCIDAPNDVCVQEGIYTYTLELESLPGGYYLIYQRCCRNNSILNIVMPGETGSTYFTKIPGPEEAQENSSPRFKKFPPIFLCSNVNFNFDHSATDPDGDSLVYSFYAPFNGLDNCCGSLMVSPASGLSSCTSPPPNCPTEAPPPPYAPVLFSPPYSSTYPLASNPALTVDPASGSLKGRPNWLGQFVVGVRVDEYRNGIMINSHFRDFQFNIKSCVVSVISGVAEQEKKCMGMSINFNNISTSNIGALTYLWNFGDPNTLADTSTAVSPSYTYQDTGKYFVTLIANPRKACSDTLRKEVYIYPELAPEFSLPGKICFKNHAYNLTAGGSILPQATYTWDFSENGLPAFSNDKSPQNVQFAEPGKHPVKLYVNQLACIDSFIDTVRLIKPPRAEITTPPVSLCDPARFTMGNGSEAEEPMTYKWIFSNGKTSTLKSPEMLFSPTGTYGATLIVSTSGVCKDPDVASINHISVYPKPRAGFKMTPEVTTILEPLIQVSSTAGDGLNYLYDFGDGTGASYHNAQHVYLDPGNYIITQYVTNVFGCTDSLSDIVQILPEYRFWMPNAFTPDDNGINDTFKPSVMGVANYEFAIYDRWGKRIFYTNDPKQGWDGNFKGEFCKQDIYAWRISFKNVVTNQPMIQSGHVTLLRNL